MSEVEGNCMISSKRIFFLIIELIMTYHDQSVQTNDLRVYVHENESPEGWAFGSCDETKVHIVEE